MQRVSINTGDMFATEYGSFYQVIKATEKTVTVRPVDSRCTESNMWETWHMPIKDAFIKNYYWDDETAERGKRCTVKWYHGPAQPSIKIAGGLDAIYWDGEPTLWDHYN